MRRDGNFVPVLVRGLLRELEETGTLNRDTFCQASTSFFDTAVTYLAAWGEHVDDLKDLQCLLLKRQPQRYELCNHIAAQVPKCCHR